MASRRKLKKDIKKMTLLLQQDCLTILLAHGAGNESKIIELMERILSISNEYVARISHTEPRGVKVFYKKLRKEFATEFNKICEELCELLPLESQQEA